ncbi:MAG: hypothetical protein A3D74_04105 [Candidatus Levybacteria bacterium RIFCSPHIGHO2_02_FULL_37_13]|nr:MAG: hypothetical protein A3D74_04105 [Candidatus Levybacteria bacterium RIFCSPHIGHO2_02_FULL_37_13]OGH29904.1 MAG: hypothetical protein A3E40_04480 [Candidatus Levybacteria bacterium RIFCSPHIGHO2_12_FULL_37_9]
MLERGFNAAREVLRSNRKKAVENGNIEQQNIVSRQEQILISIERTTREALEKYDVPDISPIKSLDDPFDALGLSPRTRNSIKFYTASRRYKEENPDKLHPFSTVGGLDNASDEELLKIRNFGEISLQEVRRKITEYKTQNGIQPQ